MTPDVAPQPVNGPIAGTDVFGRPAPGASISAESFAGVTTAGVAWAAWDAFGWLQIRFDRVLTEVERAAVRRRLISADAAEESLRAALEADLEADPAEVSMEDVRAQVQRMTRLLLSLRLPAGSILWSALNDQADLAAREGREAAASAARTAAAATAQTASSVQQAVSQLSATVGGLSSSYAAVAAGWDLLTRKVARVALTSAQRTALATDAATARAWITAHPASTASGGVLVDLLGVLTLTALGNRTNEVAKQVVWLTQKVADLEEHLASHDPGQVTQ